MDFAELIPPRSLAGAVLRLPLRLIPSNVPVRILSGKLRGKKWIPGSFIHGCWLGGYEFKKQKAFSSYVGLGAVVYDLGANVGFYSLLASKLVGDSGHVYCFEPAPRNLGYLRRHLELNAVRNCTVFECAVAADDGWAHLELGTSSATNHLAEHGIEVRTWSLDTLVETNRTKPPDFIKCDVEGAEYGVLRGAVKTLRSRRPVVFLATHGPAVHKQCCELLIGLNYFIESLEGRPIERSSELIARPSELR